MVFEHAGRFADVVIDADQNHVVGAHEQKLLSCAEEGTTLADSGRITDEGVERLRARIGVPEPHPMPPYYTLPTADTFRNVAIAYGDDNPLWCDPPYAEATRWGSSIAPPPLVGGDTLVGEDEVTEVAPADASS